MEPNQQQETRPGKVLTTREIQQKLEENAMLLEAINARQNMNSLKECVRYVCCFAVIL